MIQFAVYDLTDGAEWVCLIQTDLGVETPYKLCAPVVAESDWGTPIPRLHVPIRIDGVAHLILMSQLVALPSQSLRAMVGDARVARDAIIRAVDLLVIGF